MRYIATFFITAVLIFAGTYFFRVKVVDPRFDIAGKTIVAEKPAETPKQEDSEKKVAATTSPSTLPDKVLIENVPFTPQAPFANWDAVHEQTCEEAAVLMAGWYANGKRGGKIDAGVAEDELQRLIIWEKQRFGYFEDTTAKETAQILTDFYGVKNVTVRDDVSITSIKKELANGNLVIVLAAGRELQNPYFKQPGPIYHALTIIGYDRNEFITNDPGTRRGQGFRYPAENIIDSTHDWTGNPDTITSGPKRMIVIGTGE